MLTQYYLGSVPVSLLPAEALLDKFFTGRDFRLGDIFLVKPPQFKDFAVADYLYGSFFKGFS